MFTSLITLLISVLKLHLTAQTLKAPVYSTRSVCQIAWETPLPFSTFSQKELRGSMSDNYCSFSICYTDSVSLFMCNTHMCYLILFLSGSSSVTFFLTN